MSTIKYDNLPKNDGEVRQLILETLVGVRDGSLDTSQAVAMASLFKELNGSMNISIQAAKMSMMMEDRGRKFMTTVQVGRQELGYDDKPSEGGA